MFKYLFLFLTLSCAAQAQLTNSADSLNVNTLTISSNATTIGSGQFVGNGGGLTNIPATGLAVSNMIGVFLPSDSGIPISSGATGAVNMSNVVYCIRFQTTANIPVASNSFTVIGSAAANMHAASGIYSASGSTKLIDTGAIAVSANQAYTTALTSYILQANTNYIYAFTCDSTTPTFWSGTINGQIAKLLSLGTNPRVFTAQNNSIAGALPSSLGTYTNIGNSQWNWPLSMFYQ